MTAMTAAAVVPEVSSEEKISIEDVRGYGPAVVARRRRALNQHLPARPDPRHPQMFVIETARESFYIAPLPTGKVALLAHWR